MKNLIKNADELKNVLKRLAKDARPEPRKTLEPVDALVRAAMSFDMPDTRAEEAMRAIGKEFVDLNELRVATDLEIQELLGVQYPRIQERVAMITQSLNMIFEKEHTMNLDRLRAMSKRDARDFLRKMPDIHPFVEAYVMLMAFDGSAMPVDDQMLAYLKTQGVLGDVATLEDTQKFLEHHVKAEEMYDVFCQLRRASSESEGRKKRG